MNCSHADSGVKTHVYTARLLVYRREFMGLALWAATIVVVYGTLTLPFAVHLLLVFLWLVFSGLSFLRLTRANLRETEAVFEASIDQVKAAQEDMVLQMATYSEARDALTGEHLQRVRVIATRLAIGLGETSEDAHAIGKAAIAHDLGKIGIPDFILGKPARLTEEEYNTIKTHTLLGESALGSSPLFCLERQCARHHHEWWDGTGYPDGLAGEAIPLVARITSVADVFDALVTRRPYKDPWPVEEAIRYLRERSGTQFDPHIIRAFIDLYESAGIPTPGDRLEREESLEEGLLRDMTSRVASALLQLRDRQNSDEIAITHQELADNLGTYRETVTMTLGALQDKRVVSLQRGRIDIVDPHDLAEIVASELHSG